MQLTAARLNAARRWPSLLLMLTISACLTNGAMAIPVISLEPTPKKLGSVPPPRNLLVDITISGIPNGTFLGAFDLDFSYDPSVFVFQPLLGTEFGSGLGNSAAGEAVTGLDASTPGLVNLFEISLLEAEAASCVFCVSPYLEDLQGPSFTLATLSFAAVGSPPAPFPGGTPFTFIDTSNIVLSDQNGVSFGDSSNPALPIENQPVRITVSEPATAAMLLLGLALFFFSAERLTCWRQRLVRQVCCSPPCCYRLPPTARARTNFIVSIMRACRSVLPRSLSLSNSGRAAASRP